MDIVKGYKMYVDFQNVRIKTFIFNLFCPCCAAVKSRIRICFWHDVF